jgi:prepilin-type processing-associated H-X9-DG protein
MHQSQFWATGALKDQVPTYLCPTRRSASDNILGQPVPPNAAGQFQYPNTTGACGDYGVVLGDNNYNAGAFHVNDLYGVGFRLTDITDGDSTTLLIGEKHIPIGQLGNANYGDSCIYTADPFTVGRFAGSNNLLANSPRSTALGVFGSWHDGYVNFAFCDGHVEALPVSISGRTLGLLANRSDGQPIPNY